MLIQRVFTRAKPEYQWKKFDVCLKDHRSGAVLFSMTGVDAPAHWSQQSVEICASKYFRRAGVPKETTERPPDDDLDRGMPLWLRPSVAVGPLGSETSVAQVFHRLAGAWTYWAWRTGLLRKSEDHELNDSECQMNAEAFYDEVFYMMFHQYAAPNSPQFFNTGLWWAYGIEKEASDYWYVDESGELKESKGLYQRSQAHACFILGIKDNLIEKGGIYDLLKTEAKIFKLGSGSGTNYSDLRADGEPLSGGGVSSGVMSFLKIFDRAADCIKSGGITRRSARLICLDTDVPDLEAFISWKSEEEAKAKALVAAGYSSGIDGEAYHTVSGQNSNNSVSVSHQFMNAVSKNLDWQTWWRLDKRRHTDERGVCDWKLLSESCKPAKVFKARELWRKIAKAAWQCADPGLHFNGTMNEWNTLSDHARIVATNPCAEAVQINNSACNLLSINNLKFLKNNNTYDVDLYVHVITLSQIILETTNSMAQLPTEEIAKNVWQFRFTGMGPANLGSLLMEWGYAYDSEEARIVASQLMSIMTAQAYVTSALMAQEIGPFPGWEKTSNGMLRVIRNHRRSAYGIHHNSSRDLIKSVGDYEDLTVKPLVPQALSKWTFLHTTNATVNYMQSMSQCLWDRALSLGGSYGYRNCCTTCAAPTGTISFIMGCDSTGIEPTYALVTYKTLSGGGTMKLVNSSVMNALKRLGYLNNVVLEAGVYVEKTGTMKGCPGISEEHQKVFKCAASPLLDDVISWKDHVLMTAALQPFVSGGISKTINMPESATEEQIMEAFRFAYDTGCKGVTVYRDNCKAAAPLSVKKKEETKKTPEVSGMSWGYRKHPAEVLKGCRHKIVIGSTRGYVEIFMYDDGRIAEIFLTFGNPGSPLSNMLECWAISFSVALQRGEPLGKMCSKFIGVEFEPKGFTGRRDDIKKVSSPIDYVVRLLLKLFDSNGMMKPEPSKDKIEIKEEKRAEVKKTEETAVNLASRPMCPSCGALMTGGTDKCPSCEKCGFFSGCGG